MLAPVGEERGQLAARRRSRVVHGEDDLGQPSAQVVLAAVGKGLQCVAQHPVDPLGLGVGVDEMARARKQEEGSSRCGAKFLTRVPVDLGSWSTTSAAGTPSPERGTHDPRRVPRHVRAFPERRSTCACALSKSSWGGQAACRLGSRRLGARGGVEGGTGRRDPPSLPWRVG